jgi:hypothetical protein
MDIFIDMKNRKLTLRITESQFRNLRDRIIDESMTKSEFIRKLLDENEKSCRIEDDVNKNLQNTKNKLLSIIRGIK